MEAEGPCEVWFYHLERTALEQALPDLLDKSLSRGWRALVRSSVHKRLEELDNLLWTFRDDSFLPHGVAGEVHAARQPVLLTADLDNPNQAHVLFVIDRAELGELNGLERCILMFDGHDDHALKAARGHWKTVKDAGHPVSYWQESPERGWVKKA